MQVFGSIAIWMDKNPSVLKKKNDRGIPAVWLGRAWDSDCGLFGVYKPSEKTNSGWFWDIVKGWKECRVFDDIPCFDVDILKRRDAVDICIRRENERRLLASPASLGGQ